MAATDSGISAAACGILTIDLAAIVANWRLLATRAAPAECAAVVKADAYGLGAAKVAPALARAGCRSFFVATLEEGLALRPLLGDAAIHVLNGLHGADPHAFVEARLQPVLPSLADIDRWLAAVGDRAPAGLHLDTGMARLGLPPQEVDRLAQDRDRIARLNLGLVMSHLACPDEPAHPMNAAQLARFQSLLDRLKPPPQIPRSLAASSGIFLGADFAFDLVRPGASLYGVPPLTNHPNPMKQVIHLQGKILQTRFVDTDMTVGYGATHRFAGPARLATVGVGYADGFMRALSNRGGAYIGGRRVPLVGRVSMDLITLDVSELPEATTQPGALVDLIGPHNPLDTVGAEAGTIGYEVLTSLGRRYQRRYVGDDASA
jgi:alanine racemase